MPGTFRERSWIGVPFTILIVPLSPLGNDVFHAGDGVNEADAEQLDDKGITTMKVQRLINCFS